MQYINIYHDKTEHTWKHTCISIYIKPLRTDPTEYPIPKHNTQ